MQLNQNLDLCECVHYSTYPGHYDISSPRMIGSCFAHVMTTTET